MERLENLNFLELFDYEEFNEWVGYLASLKSVTKENVFGEGKEFEECVQSCLSVEVFADEEVVDPVAEQMKLKELLNEGFQVVEVRAKELVLSKSRKLSLEEVVEKLRQDVRPYRTLFLHASRLDSEKVEQVLRRARG